MNTKPLYLTDAYLKTCKAEVLEIEKKGNTSTLVLDKTVFYPEGGGQPSDQGIIKNKKNIFNVTQVLLKGDKIIHYGKLNGDIKVGDIVECEIDWQRRYKNMKIHSAGHILHEAVKILFPEIIPIEGQHGKNPYISYKSELNPDQSRRILETSNELVRQNLKINTEFVTLEELKKRSPWVPEHLPTNKPLRIMWVGNFAPIPDGGTQIKNTSEIKEFIEVKIENKDNEAYVFYKIAAENFEPKTNDNQSQTKRFFGGVYTHKGVQNDNPLKEEIINLKNQAIAQIEDAKTGDELEQIRINLLGRNGKLTNLIKEIRKLEGNERKEVGFVINVAKNTIEEFLGSQKNKIKEKKEVQFDPTVPGIKPKIGHFHPTTLVIEEMFEIFKHLGFSITEGPEIESDVYNFEKLNLPKDHPARSLQDVLYIEEPDVLLRSHTSSVETRVLENIKPPFRVVVAGKCYRFENVNASNNAMFYQFQGVALQEGLSMVDLKGTLYSFAKAFFGENREFRFRCKYYPEVEPGAGLDVNCPFCNKKGCSICKYRGWLEMLGCGMIHPNILKNFGYDPKKISGFAFGMGLDRIVMDRFKIKDIRSLYNGDIKY